MGDVVIVNYSAGNIFSVQTACRRLGYESVISDSPGVITGAAKVIIPGVGSSGSAMESLESAGLTCLIPRLNQPVLGICLGMQLMYSRLDESDDTGLKIFDGRVSLFPPSELPVPHMGWNRIFNLKGPLFSGIDEGEWFYFVHSYMAPAEEDTIALCNYGGPFTAAAARDNFFGCQFHPEKSGEAGQRVIKNFLEI
ncbi:MAG: imidazole glycerol phosphate synthase subunit HisH [Bacteroidales bacterium]|jgi:glutamine amidotransferase|nr:imidazole glycerol phosphate synthase subunit HisH [Bacteroidales bacterium]